MKAMFNPVFYHFSSVHETLTWVRPMSKFLNNMMNPNMNNVNAIDYANKDWIEDNDFCISRKSSEFPRLSNKYTNYFD
jgi:hypothetical protein